MKIIFLFFNLFIFHSSFAQIPSMFRVGTATLRDENAEFLSVGNGRLLLSYSSKPSINSDSTYWGLTMLNSNLEPEWTKIISSRVRTNLRNLQLAPNGHISGNLLSFNLNNIYYSYQFNMTPTGDILTISEIKDSTTSHVVYVNRLQFPDNSESGCFVHHYWGW